MHVTDKFHRPMFISSEVIVLTNKQTDKQTNRRRWKHPSRSTLLRRWVKIIRIFKHRQQSATYSQERKSCPLSTTISLYVRHNTRFYIHLYSPYWQKDFVSSIIFSASSYNLQLLFMLLFKGACTFDICY